MDYIINYFPFIPLMGFCLFFMIDYIAYCATSAVYRASRIGNAVINRNDFFGIGINLSNFALFGFVNLSINDVFLHFLLDVLQEVFFYFPF